MVLYVYIYIYIYIIYSIRFAKPDGPVEDLQGFMYDGFHDVQFLFVMNVGFRLSLYLNSGAILCRLGCIWASFEAQLDVIGPPNGAPKRLGTKMEPESSQV